MNSREALTTLVDAARTLPENDHLNRAIKWAEKKIERRADRHDNLFRRRTSRFDEMREAVENPE